MPAIWANAWATSLTRYALRTPSGARGRLNSHHFYRYYEENSWCVDGIWYIYRDVIIKQQPSGRDFSLYCPALAATFAAYRRFCISITVHRGCTARAHANLPGCTHAAASLHAGRCCDLAATILNTRRRATQLWHPPSQPSLFSSPAWWFEAMTGDIASFQESVVARLYSTR